MDLAHGAGTITDNAKCDESVGLEVTCVSENFCCGRLKPTTVDGIASEKCLEKTNNGQVINNDGKTYLFYCNSYAELKATSLIVGAASLLSAVALMWNYSNFKYK